MGLLLLVVLVGVVWWTNPSAEPRALHYNIYFGIDLYGSGYSLWWNPIVASAVWLFNMIAAGVVLERQLLAARILTWSATVTAGIVLAATVLVVTYQPFQ